MREKTMAWEQCTMKRSDQLREGHRPGQTLATEGLKEASKVGAQRVTGRRVTGTTSHRVVGAMLELLILFQKLEFTEGF